MVTPKYMVIKLKDFVVLSHTLVSLRPIGSHFIIIVRVITVIYSPVPDLEVRFNVLQIIDTTWSNFSLVR